MPGRPSPPGGLPPAGTRLALPPAADDAEPLLLRRRGGLPPATSSPSACAARRAPRRRLARSLRSVVERALPSPLLLSGGLPEAAVRGACRAVSAPPGDSSVLPTAVDCYTSPVPQLSSAPSAIGTAMAAHSTLELSPSQLYDPKWEPQRGLGIGDVTMTTDCTPYGDGASGPEWCFSTVTHKCADTRTCHTNAIKCWVCHCPRSMN